jgi:opacity protein-like surface antigen
MRQMARWLVAVVGTMGVVAAARAGDVSSHRDDSMPFEVAGFGAYNLGGQFKLQGGGAVPTGTGDRLSLNDHSAFAVAADLRANETTQFELFYSHEATQLQVYQNLAQTDVAVSYLHIGGTILLNEDDRALKPYAAGGLGITRLSPGDEGNTDTRFSASLGLGLRWPATQHLSLRLEGRAFVTLMNDNAVFCKSDETGLLCRVHGNGTTFIQGQFLAGVAFVF